MDAAATLDGALHSFGVGATGFAFFSASDFVDGADILALSTATALACPFEEIFFKGTPLNEADVIAQHNVLGYSGMVLGGSSWVVITPATVGKTSITFANGAVLKACDLIAGTVVNLLPGNTNATEEERAGGGGAVFAAQLDSTVVLHISKDADTGPACGGPSLGKDLWWPRALKSDDESSGRDAAGSKPSIISRACGVVPLSCAPTGCAKAIVQAMQDCSASGGGTVSLSAGTYHLNDTNWVPIRQPMLILKNLNSVALVGHAGTGGYYTDGPDPTATTLLIYGMQGAFSWSNCTNIKARGLQVDMHRQPYTYGICTAASVSSFTVKFDPERYPFLQPIPDYLLEVQSVMGFDPVAWRMAYNPTDIYVQGKPYKCTVSGTEITCATPPRAGTPIKVGKAYVLRHQIYSVNGFDVEHSTNVEAEDVHLYSIPGMGFGMEQTNNVHLKSCGVRWRPGRPMSITADASHFNECSGNVHLDSVHFEGQGDDGMNVHGMFHDVRSPVTTYCHGISLTYCLCVLCTGAPARDG